MMMKFANLEINDLQQIFADCTQHELHELIDYVDDVAQKEECLTFNIKKKYSVKKQILINYLISVFVSQNSILNIYNKLTSSKVSEYVYGRLIWEDSKIETSEIVEKFNYKFKVNISINYGTQTINLVEELSLVVRMKTYHYSGESDRLYLNDKFKTILKLAYPIPKDYDLEAVILPKETKYSYSNEQGVLNFISVISDMLKNNLVGFGKTNEKPLAKTLNILKSSTGVNEFYSDKKLDTLAVDMLTRSFYYYRFSVKKFDKLEYNTLKQFVLAQMEDKLRFFISRIFFGHLKKVRYDSYYSSQKNIFNMLKIVIKDMPKDDFVSVDNILKYCKYRDVKVDIESSYKTDEYSIEYEIVSKSNVIVKSLCAYDDYDALVLEPVIKASLFYLGALGLIELKYDEPVSPYSVVAKGKLYISAWDSLKYIKLTKLGKYIFGFNNSYKYEKIVKKQTKLKFDEYKPIITVDKQESIMLAKLEAYTDKYDENRYVLSYAKIFRDAKTKKALELKIDGFYKQIEENPPKVFREFFDEIVKNSNMLKRDLKQVVIELNNNKKLLNLFMKNRKLQELVIKAEGYRVIVLKENMSKLTKIIKDNGFFIEF